MRRTPQGRRSSYPKAGGPSGQGRIGRARHEPPLLQIGPRHKVACHVAVELGHHPAQPVTAPLHADGAPTQEGNRLVEVSSDVGFGDRWLDLGSGDVVAAGRKVAGGGAAGGENLPMQG